jgi:hypothetical protein
MYDKYRSRALGLFLQIYHCFVCAMGEAIGNGTFEEPGWVALVNHFPVERFQQALTAPTPEYARYFEMLGCQQILQGTNVLTSIQRCTEDVGKIHLLTDLSDALRDLGCATAAQKRDYAKIVPIFASCNRAVLGEEFPVIGGLVADYIAIPQITDLRNQAWTNAGCP